MIEEAEKKSTADEPILGFVPYTAVLLALRKHTYLVVLAAVAGMLVGLPIALLIPNQYTSTTQMMPPDPQTFSNATSPTLQSLTGINIPIGGVGARLLDDHTAAGTVEGILRSRKVQDDLIDKYDLRTVYHKKLYLDARKKLGQMTEIQEDKKSGLISISVTDRDKSRAQKMAGEYVQELNSLVNILSTSSARRQRVFLEARLETVKDELDKDSQELSQFSSRTGTLDVGKQGQATMEAAEKLQGEIAVARSDLSGLSAVYTDDNVRVQEARHRVDELEREFNNMVGSAGKQKAGQPNLSGPIPSIRSLPLLGVTYFELYNRLTMQQTIYETLSKEYELAKVREAEEIPQIAVLEEPDLPEKKSKPSRSLIVLGFGIVGLLGGAGWAVMKEQKQARSSEF